MRSSSPLSRHAARRQDRRSCCLPLALEVPLVIWNVTARTTQSGALGLTVFETWKGRDADWHVKASSAQCCRTSKPGGSQ
eukprot:2224343-Pleurochrysis_carterae.AAC.2